MKLLIAIVYGTFFVSGYFYFPKNHIYHVGALNVKSKYTLLQKQYLTLK